MLFRYLVVFLSLCALPAYAADEPDHDIHQELRAILGTLQQAINGGNFDAMLPVVSEQIMATTITQEVMSNRKEVSAYFKKWFGPGGYLKKLDMNMTADALTELSPDKSWGLVRGSGLEGYTLSDGRHYDMKTRWTAVVAKEQDGKWRLRAIHIGTNFLDNPILSEAEGALWKVGIGAGLAGLLLGALAAFLLARRKK
jgi:ketosteroid isomerase-like protein